MVLMVKFHETFATHGRTKIKRDGEKGPPPADVILSEDRESLQPAWQNTPFHPW